jgi:thiamine biosynthesis protein ThiS
MSLTLLVNGQSRVFTSLPDSPSLADLVRELGLKSDRVAVEHNGEIAVKSVWQETTLSEGDRLEIVHFVGGG